MSEQANSSHLTDNLLTLNFRVLQCKMVVFLVQQIVAFVLEPVKSKLIIGQWLNCNWNYQKIFLIEKVTGGIY